MKHIGTIAFTALFTIITALFGFVKLDDDIIKKVAARLNIWATANPQEKVYLHLDKLYYAIGDDIWFKAYVITGSKHQLSAISNILTVDLIDEQDSISKSIRIPLIAGLGFGDFKLADSLKEGNYRIRAYTNWMRNAGSDYFFDKTIQIGNSINNTVFAKTSYTYSTVNNKQKVSAVINYSNFNGQPYPAKQVSYEVLLDSKHITRGKGITDNDGNLSLSFTNNSPVLYQKGTIITELRIGDNQFVTKTLPIKATSAKIDVQFFPESGYLVNGVRSKVAFKAIGADGLGVEIKGSVVDDQNNEIAKIETQHLGMGSFYFLPEAGKAYRSKLIYPDGSTSILNLPSAIDKGYVLSIYNNPESDDVIVKVTLSQATLRDNLNTDINLIAQSGGAIVFAAQTKLESTSFVSKIPKSRFPSGINQFTLISAKGEPLNERIIFIQNSDQLNIDLHTARQNYAPHEKVKLSIDAKDKDGKPVVGAFSLSVIDESKIKVDESSENTILANILLASDIKGYVEKPNYYFTNPTDKTRSDLDLLMLTQGYRRFDWKQLMADVLPVLTFKPEKSLDVTGQIKTLWGKPISHGKVSLISTSGTMFLLDTIADDQGHFTFKNIVFSDSVKFIIQARTAKDRNNVQIDLDRIMPQMISGNKNNGDIEVNINTTIFPYLQNSKKQFDDFLKFGLVSRSNLLKEVSISDKKKRMESSNLNGPGNADQIINSEMLQSCTTLESCLQGRLLGAVFRNHLPYLLRSNSPMLIVVDGISVESDFLSTLDPGNVKSIELLKSMEFLSVYGSRGGGGVLIITTKRGQIEFGFQRYAPGVVIYNPLGYYRARSFYVPQYNDVKANTKITDLRTTIYWNPNVITDKNGNTNVQFFNADSPGTYRAVIEGIDANGNLGRTVYRYKVQ